MVQAGRQRASSVVFEGTGETSCWVKTRLAAEAGRRPDVQRESENQRTDGQVVVALRGKLDELDAASLAAALAEVAAREPVIIVDLAGLAFIDSSGVEALVLVRKQARQAGGDLLLAAPQAPVMRFLTVTRLV